MIDASASLYDYGFKSELEFVSDIIDKVGPISKDGLRAGVVVYSDKANSRIYMNDHFNTDAFKFAVGKLPYDNAGQTRIDLGFAESKKLFLTENGARPSSKKVIFFSCKISSSKQRFIETVSVDRILISKYPVFPLLYYMSHWGWDGVGGSVLVWFLRTNCIASMMSLF